MMLTRPIIVLVLALAGGPLFLQPAASTSRALQTPLDMYVAAPDPSFTWRVASRLPADGATATLLDMTSQRGLTEQEVERPLWTHWLTVITPKKVKNDIALLFVNGGRLDRPQPSAVAAWLLDLARDTGTVVAELRLVPNQP